MRICYGVPSPILGLIVNIVKFVLFLTQNKKKSEHADIHMHKEASTLKKGGRLRNWELFFFFLLLGLLHDAEQKLFISLDDKLGMHRADADRVHHGAIDGFAQQHRRTSELRGRRRMGNGARSVHFGEAISNGNSFSVADDNSHNAFGEG